MSDEMPRNRSIMLPAVVGILAGVVVAMVILLVVALGRLDHVASSATRQAQENIEVVCTAINKGRAYSRVHVKGYGLGPLPCQELVQKTIRAGR